MEETYAHELEGQTVVISSKPDQQGKQAPISYLLQVHLLNGLAIQNVMQVDFEPLFAAKPIYATLTLAHLTNFDDWPNGDDLTEEKVRVQVHLDGIPAIVKEESTAVRILTNGMHRCIMHTMNISQRNPVMRVYPHTRQKLKVMAAQHKMTMQDMIEWLVVQQMEREKGASKDAGSKS